MKPFTRHCLLLFLALRAGDFVNVAAGMWFVPLYVSGDDIGAVLPLGTFATFAALPVFAMAMTLMREASVLAARGCYGKIKSLYSTAFAATAVASAAVLVVAAFAMPRFMAAMRVSKAGAATGFLVVASALAGCAAPVYTDALQSLKKFGALAAVEAGGAVCRFLVMAVIMPFKALTGYFAGQTALPVFRIIASAAAVRKRLDVPSEPFWDRESVKRIASGFLRILVYQAVPMAVALLEQSVLRRMLSAGDSAGYYIATRFSDLLYYMTFPLLAVMFPYSASAAGKGASVRPYVARCMAWTAIAALVLALAGLFAGENLIALLPNGAAYTRYAKYIPALSGITALTSCQVFYTNAEISAARYGFMKWFMPLHAVYAACLYAASAWPGCQFTFEGMLAVFAVFGLLRFGFSFYGLLHI